MALNRSQSKVTQGIRGYAIPNSMTPILTPRLILRSIQPDEVDVLQEMLAVEDIKAEFKNIAALGKSGLERELVVRMQAGDGGRYPWLWIINKGTKEIVGFILARHYTVPRKARQIYYAVRPSSRRQGFATEALAGLAQQFWRVDRVPIVFVRGHAKNEGSKKTALAAGFRGSCTPISVSSP